MTPRNLARSLAVFAGLLIAAVSLAQQAPASPRSIMSPGARVWSPTPGSPNYGTADLSYVRLSGTEFTPYLSSQEWGTGPGLHRYPLSGVSMEAVPHLPTGSIIDYVELDFCDSNVASDISATVYDCGALGATCSTIVTTVVSTGSPGCSSVSASGIGYEVANAGGSLDVEVQAGANDGSVSVGGVVIGYRLQVSPAPAIATFPVDVPPSHPFFQFVEALAAAGITAGVGPGEYGVDQSLTRGQMAVFLSLALGLHFPN
jgi:S-layer family protein